MNDSISYSNYPAHNGGSFMSNNQASIAGCAGTSCNILAANSVFTDPIDQGKTLAPVTKYNPSCGMSGGAKKRKYNKRTTRKHKSKKHMKGGKQKSRKSRKSRKSMKRRRHSTKKQIKRSRRSHGRKYRRRTMKGGAKNQQLMGNICHSTGYSIGPLNTEIKPTDVGLASGHFDPYTKSQHN